MVCVTLRTIELFITLAKIFYFVILMGFANFFEVFTLIFIILNLLIFFYLFLIILYYILILNWLLLWDLYYFIYKLIAMLHVNFRILITFLNRTINSKKSLVCFWLFLCFSFTVVAYCVITYKNKRWIVYRVHLLVA
jgi:hypothetical protein